MAKHEFIIIVSNQLKDSFILFDMLTGIESWMKAFNVLMLVPRKCKVVPESSSTNNESDKMNQRQDNENFPRKLHNFSGNYFVWKPHAEYTMKRQTKGSE